ncbi:MAG: ABC transporter permease [Tannerellaceae bacterium]|jgi:ABC-type lipoprotein release transport system permease subunit|nr:ABC transporter permease [Tannerellaceae bacterium]
MMKLVWRNIWRNRRRAIITISSVFFAVLFCALMISFQTGVWEKMIDNTLRSQTGHIQVHAKGYWEDKTIDNFMFVDDASMARLEAVDNITNVSPRVETFAMASHGLSSKGIAVIGISPGREEQKSNLPIKLVGGEYLSETDDGLLIGQGLGKYLGVGIGDTLALIGQGYHGSSAVGLFPVRGILNLVTAEMDNGIAYMSLAAAQKFIDMPDGYSGLLIAVADNKRLDATIAEVEAIVDTEALNVYSWHFTMERLLQSAETDKAFNVVIMYIMYVIVGFGILGTIIMMTNERRREFCVMISVGMQRWRLALIVAAELLVMSLTGVVAALALALPIARWFNRHPIEMTGEMAEMYRQYGMEPLMPFSVNPGIFAEQVVIILVIAMLAIIYPVNKISKLKIVGK